MAFYNPLEARLQSPFPYPTDADAVTAMAHRLCIPEGKEIYAKRKSTVGTYSASSNEVLGFRRFNLRRPHAARGKWNPVCVA